MPIRIAICDDTAEDVGRLSDALRAYDPTFEITTYSSGEALLDELLNSNVAIDLLFLDIYMPETDGIKTAQRIRAGNKNVKIIFVSSSKDHYPQAYEVFAFNYILKPFDREKLRRVLDRVIVELAGERRHKVCFNYKSTAYAVDCRDILYIESRNKLVLFHLMNGNSLQCYSKLDEMAKELPQQYFIRCHKSFIVNAFSITEMGEDYFRLDQVLVGISKKFLKRAKDQYYAYLFLHMGREQS